jgi:class 3 adenylate cyclase
MGAAGMEHAERVLVADDSDDVRYSLGQRLARFGFRNVEVAGNGRVALERLRAEHFDLLLLDIMMPECTGFEVLESLRASGRLGGLPVIVISALDELSAAIRCIQLGAEDYLTKPIEPTLLQARVSNALEKKRLRDATERQLEIIRGALGRYVPDSVVAQVVSGEGKLEPTKTLATIVYTDIEAFTSIVENMAPEQAVAMLNEYFEAMSAPLLECGGTINQFQGDAMLVTFNVPVPDPRHAERALEAAIRLQQCHRGRRFGGVSLKTRVGINSGDVLAGNVGSGKRVVYTVHGDAVNLAARLEVLNKDLGTRVLLSGATRALLSDPEQVLRVSEVTVRGRTAPLTVYTPRALLGP